MTIYRLIIECLTETLLAKVEFYQNRIMAIMLAFLSLLLLFLAFLFGDAADERFNKDCAHGSKNL